MPVVRTACGDASVRRLSRPNARGSWPACAIERASRVQPETPVVAAANRTSAPARPTKIRSASSIPAGSSLPSSSTIPSTGARSQSVPSCVEPFASAGNAESATTATST